MFFEPRYFAIALLLGCGHPNVAEPTLPALVSVTVIGTNDLHGHLSGLPYFAAYLSRVRQLLADHGGAVVLLDGGDLFTGTLESNLVEGISVVDAYNALGYDAVAVGNHEFDFGPVGPLVTMPEGEVDVDGRGLHSRGALEMLIRRAHFPFLTSNVFLPNTMFQPQGVPNTMGIGDAPSIVIERQGLRIGIIGGTTEELKSTTLLPNVEDLTVDPLVLSLTREANRLRTEEHVDLVLAVLHAGGRCEAFDDPLDLSSCDPEEEVQQLAFALPRGAIDVIVGGHTHRGVAHEMNGIAVIESHAYGAAFGRVDLEYDTAQHRLVSRSIHPPITICQSNSGPSCLLAYEGQALTPDSNMAEVINPYMASAEGIRNRALNITFADDFLRSYDTESALGNLLSDAFLLGATTLTDDIGVIDSVWINGGGIRADVSAGPVTYGDLYEAFPFDNRLAVLELSQAEVCQVLIANARSSHGFLSIGGGGVRLSCLAGGEVSCELTGFTADRRLRIATSDFLVLGGDHTLAEMDLTGRVHMFPNLVRDVIESGLTQLGTPPGTGPRSASASYTAERPRVVLPGARPICQ